MCFCLLCFRRWPSLLLTSILPSIELMVEGVLLAKSRISHSLTCTWRVECSKNDRQLWEMEKTQFIGNLLATKYRSRIARMRCDVRQMSNVYSLSFQCFNFTFSDDFLSTTSFPRRWSQCSLWRSWVDAVASVRVHVSTCTHDPKFDLDAGLWCAFS